jgi:hypothetical protein
LSVRLKLTLSYAGFLMLAGVLMLAAFWVVLLRYIPNGVLSHMHPSWWFVFDRSDPLHGFGSIERWQTQPAGVSPHDLARDRGGGDLALTELHLTEERFAIERVSRDHVSRDIGNVNTELPFAAVKFLHVDGIVEIAGIVGIDRDDKLRTQIFAIAIFVGIDCFRNLFCLLQDIARKFRQQMMLPNN